MVLVVGHLRTPPYFPCLLRRTTTDCLFITNDRLFIVVSLDEEHLTKPRPQPDYAAGFKRTAFTEDQLKKIQPFIGGFSEMSLFMSMYYMYFPFLTYEVKCGAAALDVADRQNESVQLLMTCRSIRILRSRSNPSQGNPGSHRA